MTPVIIGDATLYLGDCLDILPTLGKVDVVITDPPYGIAAGREKPHNGWSDYGISDWDLCRPGKEVFEAFLGKGDVVIIWGGQYFTDYLPPSMKWLAWDKGQDGFSLADFELAWTNQNKAARRLVYPRALALKDIKQHPTQKPVAVMAWCIEQAGIAREILDPFMGSGTTGVAAIQLGRKFIGIEKDPKYFQIAVDRITQAVAQGQLFKPEIVKPVQEALFT
jgi:DNA modification methylase